MSDVKRSGSSSKGGRRRPRSKAETTESVESPPHEDEAFEAEGIDQGESVAETAPTSSEEAPMEVRAEDASGESRDETRREQHPARENRQPEPKFRPSDEYTLQVHYDKAARNFQASFAEFPELRAAGNTKESVVRDAESRLENHLQNLRRNGGQVPEAIYSRRYPEKLEVRVSPNLYRRLDLLSRHEKVGLDQLVTELLTVAMDKKTEQPRQHQHHQDRQPRSNAGNQQQQQRHQQHQRGRGQHRNFHETMDNRENFMEYVRNLEKGNLRKK